MTEIPNAKRSLLQATYSPIRLDEPPQLGRAWEKWSFYSSLAAAVKDWTRVRHIIERDLIPTEDPRIRTTLERTLSDLAKLEALRPTLGTPYALNSVSAMNEIASESLIVLGEKHLQLEEEDAVRLLHAYDEIEDTFQKSRTEVAPRASERNLKGFRLLAESTTFAPNLNIFGLERELPPNRGRIEPRIAARRPDDSSGRSAPRTSVRGGRITNYIAIPKTQETVPTYEARSYTATASAPLSEVSEWAIKNDVRPEEAKELRSMASEYGVPIPKTRVKPLLSARIDNARLALEGFRKRMQVEPAGLLHLERLSFTPAGIERGELVYSVPLSPAEEIHLSHKEWSTTEQELETIVTDYLEDYSEKGVTEKSELTDATNNQNQQTTGYNTGVNVKGGYGPVSISSSFSYNVADSASQSEQQSRTRSREATNKASSRTKKEHKTSFRLASAAGTEDQRVQTIRNPYEDRTLRVDYYQMIRRWRVDLERYGIRLTYDITIPDPARDLLQRQLEIRELEAQLTEEFKFEVQPYEITRTSYPTYAAQFQAFVDSPPPLTIDYTNHEELSWQDFDEGEHVRYHALELNIDSRYTVTGVETYSNYGFFGDADDPDGTPDLYFEVGEWQLLGTTGSISAIYVTDDLAASWVFIKVTATLQQEYEQAWQLKAWNTIREAAQAAFEANKSKIQERLKQLYAELENIDALRLRKIEREEIMKGVLRWILGPTFRFVPTGIWSNDSGLVLYGSEQQVLSDDVWSRALAYGEFINFIHNAIEWENMLYFLYPYFWSPPLQWDFRQGVRHPDATHEQFLKAGSVRVVFPIRRGFENDFLSLMDTGEYNKLPNTHPYVSIATEMENYAKTNYPGIPSANPSKQGGAWRQIQTFREALQKFFSDCGRYPSEEEGLQALLRDPGATGWQGPYLTEVPNDPWGNAYRYIFPGQHADFDIVSFGADGRFGGVNENEDVVSWAEGTLIGTWIEYTPTSALDIALTDSLPNA